VPWQLVKIDAGDAVPADPGALGGLVFMGGPMSVNDDLPWIGPVLQLIRRAVESDVPVLGHCLGGQLMAKALGASVTRNAVKEIGWGEVEVVNPAAAQDWFGSGVEGFTSFHWHGETFAIPAGATRILSSRHCANQAFAYGEHLALQCHVEMTAPLVQSWCASGAREIAASPGPAVQAPEQIQRDLDVRVAQLNRIADRIYHRWCRALR